MKKQRLKLSLFLFLFAVFVFGLYFYNLEKRVSSIETLSFQLCTSHYWDYFKNTGFEIGEAYHKAAKFCVEEF